MNPIFIKVQKLVSGKNTFLVAVVVLALLLFRQCGITNNAKKEAERSLHNLLAEQDSVKVIKSKLGNVLVEKSAFQLKYSELSADQKELISQLELGKNKRPGVVIETQVVYRDSLIMVPVSTQIKDGVSQLAFNYDPILPGSNKLSISGKIPYTMKNDTLANGVFSSILLPGQANLSIEQRIDLVTGLYRDPKTNRLFVRASTSFPGIAFNDIQALDMVDDPGTRKALKGARKPFALGFNFGYGMVISPSGYMTGPSIGVGLNYSPKFLQFGK